MIALKNVSKTIKKKEIIKGITYEFSDQIYGLLGENGAGKTTLLRCIADVLHYDTGEILWEGASTVNNQEYKKKLGYLPQKLGVIPDLTVFQLMEFYAALKCIPARQVKEEIVSCLSQVGLEEYKNQKASILSGGMMRRLGIAQALLGDPAILLFDEATVGLDPEERIRFKSMVSRIAGNKTVVISTHIVDEIESLCSKILVMHEGRIIADCTGEELKQFAVGKVYEMDAETVKENEIICTLKRYEVDGKIVERVLAAGQIAGVEQKPTLEEGYLCLIRQS